MQTWEVATAGSPQETLMPPIIKRPPFPSEDKRWRIMQGAMRRHGIARDALIVHACLIYMGTACYIKGEGNCWTRFAGEYGIDLTGLR
jgi:hypothetical protein